ncbi:aldo/keto reductase [Paucibacter sp. KBW04]|nr:aldo/keto reductase [Paucibacter sp. KBW04]
MGWGGGWNAEPVEEAHIAAAHAALEAALESGISQLDHADIYTRGKAEQCMGELFKRQPSLRQRLTLQSKCSIRPADEAGPHRYDLSAAHIEASVEAILRRLQVEHLDLLLLHRPDPLMEADEVAAAFARLRAAGKVSHLGVSNMAAAQLRSLQASLDQPLLVNQLEMSLAKLDWLEAGVSFNDPQSAQRAGRGDWLDTLDYCRAAGVQLQAWGALARGMFSGRLPKDATEAQRQCAALVESMAAEQKQSAEALLLAWLMRHPAGIQPLVGSADPSRIRACAQAALLTMSRADWYRLYLAARAHPLP